MTGRVVAVVGPSGVGKDSVMAGIAAAAPGWRIVRRTISQPPGPGEAFDSVAPDAFEAMAARGAFCLHWGAHGLRYGIPASVLDRARAGQDFLVNLSRGVLAEAHALFPRFAILALTARPETLAARLGARGREGADDIAARLAREGATAPPGVPRTEIANDGPLDDTIARALTALEALP
ncbi:MAG: phosphonate metabolism protein/1,5-bisphosphokinase (PRPP-forming) PhnN [Shimia sp.]